MRLGIADRRRLARRDARVGPVSASIGFATLRLRADYLAITTFGVAVTFISSRSTRKG